MTFIAVRHNIEVAHRMFDMQGKCQQIHGHSMWVELKIHGLVNGKGVLDDLEFGSVKRQFREHLDTHYDHHLLLNERDPFSKPLFVANSEEGLKYDGSPLEDEDLESLPGLKIFSGDPTTENIAKWIAQWASKAFNKSVDVLVNETLVNAASYSIR